MENLGKDERGVAFRMGRKVARIWRKVVAGWKEITKEITGEAWLERYQVLQGDLIRSGVERRKKIEEERVVADREWVAERHRQLWRVSHFGQECQAKWGWMARKVRAKRKNRREEGGRRPIDFGDRELASMETGAWGPGKILCRGCMQAWSPGFYEKHVCKDGGRRPGGIPGVIPDYYPFGMWQRSQSNYFEGMSYMGRKELELAMGVAAVPSTWREEVDVTRESKNSGRKIAGLHGVVAANANGWPWHPEGCIPSRPYGSGVITMPIADGGGW